MDGAACGGKVIYGTVLPFTAVLNGFTDGATLRKFMFSSLGLTGAITCSKFPVLGWVT
jgi:hypothetical protein